MNYRNIPRNKFIGGGLIILIVFIFLYLKIIPNGEIIYQRSWPRGLSSGKGFIYNFTPVDRVSGENDNKIIGDPVYFTLFTPRPFSQVTITLVYHDYLQDKTPIIELGVLADKLTWKYNLQAVDNKILDKLKKEWVAIDKKGTLFLQKKLTYNSLEEFSHDLKRQKLKDCLVLNSCLAVYNYPFNYKLIKKVSKENSSFDIPLRGSHQFYIYNSKNTLQLNILFADLNQDSDSDSITVNVYQGNKLIAEKTLLDDNKDPVGGKVEVKKINLTKSGLEEGVYKVEIRINKDVVIKKITTSASQISFIHKLWPVSYPHPMTFYTDANYIQTKILNPASRQEIEFGEKKYNIVDTYKQKIFYSSHDYNRIDLTKDDIIIENNGVFALSQNGLLNPSIKKVDNYLSLNNIKYVIAQYSSPQYLDNGDISATINIDLKSAYREKGKYFFVISIPGLEADDDIDDYIEIKDIKVELKGRSLGEKIKSWF